MLMYLRYRDYTHCTVSYKTVFYYRFFVDLKYPLLRLKCIHDGCHLSLGKQWDEGDDSRRYCISEGWFLHKAEE